jgi:IS605 OrfB family transposase
MITVAKDIKQHSRHVSNLEELKTIAVRYATVKDYVFLRYSGINSIVLLDRYKKDIRDEWMKTDFADQWKLPARYWKLALDEAVSNIKTEWSNTKNRVNDAVRSNPNLTEDEKKFIYYVLKSNSILQAILTHKNFKKIEKLSCLTIRERYICNLIRRYIRRYKGAIAYSKRKKSFMIDAPMYKYKVVNGENIIEITGLNRGKRIDIILRDKNVHSGNLRLVIGDDDTVVIHRHKKVAVKINNNTESILGVDKGYTDLFAASSGNFYGSRLSEFLTKETERLNYVNAKRNKIWALIEKYEKLGNEEKAERIRNNNFGKVKYNGQKRRFDEKVKSYINREINVMYDVEKPTEIVLEKLDFYSWVKKLSKKIKRSLSRWIKGYIQERLEYKASLMQIKVTMVNPAYTSQVCHKCGSFGKRDGKKFSCPDCGAMDADYNASVNIKNRKSDSEITLYTKHKTVEEILKNRHSLRLNQNLV